MATVLAARKPRVQQPFRVCLVSASGFRAWRLHGQSLSKAKIQRFLKMSNHGNYCTKFIEENDDGVGRRPSSLNELLSVERKAYLARRRYKENTKTLPDDKMRQGLEKQAE